MTLTQLGYVVAVDTHRNFVAASNHCFISQPTLSMQIKKMEEELEVVIFDRGRQPVVPTQMGEAIIAQARIILREAERLEEMIVEARGEVRGEFQLGIIPTLSATVLPLFLRAFTSRYPAVGLVIRELQTEQILEQLGRDELDAGIAATPLGQPDLHERPLFQEPFYLYVSPRHPLAKQETVQESDLLGQTVWLLSEGHCLRNQVVRLCGLQQQPLEGFPVRFESGNLQTLIRLVEQNFGMTLLPHLAVRELKNSSRKKMVRAFAAPVPAREVSLVYRREHVKRRITEVLFEEIVAALPQELRTQPNSDEHVVSPLSP